MVPDRWFKTRERLTGNWWMHVQHGWFRPKLQLMVEIEEGWVSGTPPPPGQQPVLDWRSGSRRATAAEIYTIALSNGVTFQYRAKQ